MKVPHILSLLILCTASSFAAENPIIMTQGFIGTEGSSGISLPKDDSVAQAVALYDALEVKPDSEGDKRVGISIDGEFYGLRCKQPRNGIHLTEASCDSLTLAREVAPLEE